MEPGARLLTRRQIIRDLWAANEAEKTGQLRVYMAYLREKLEAIPARPELLVTEPGIGYRLVLPDWPRSSGRSS